MVLKTAQYYQNIIDKNDGVSFHSREMKRLKEDPENKTYKAAEDYAKGLTDKFMNKVRDHTQPGHEEALYTYLNQYQQSESNVHSDSLNTACSLLNAAPIEWQNLSLETNLLKKYPIHTLDDAAFVDKFKNLAQLKFKAEGYKDLDQFETNFWEKHPLSTKVKTGAGGSNVITSF